MMKALIFDFDGTILDTETADYISIEAIYNEYGCVLPLDFWALSLGTSPSPVDLFDSLEEQLGKALNKKALHEKRYQLFHQLIEKEQPRAGVADLLRTSIEKGLKNGLASSAGNDWVSFHLDKFGLLPLFECIRTFENVAKTKPHPDLYLSAVEGLNIAPHEAIAIEDSPNGILAAKRAGLYCVAVPNPITCRLDLSKADLILGSLEDIKLDELVQISLGNK